MADTIFQLVLGGALLIAGGWYAVLGWLGQRKARNAAEHWAIIDAKIEQSQYTKTIRVETDEDSHGFSRTREYPEYRPFVRYTYWRDGQERTGNTIRFDEIVAGSERAIDGLLAQYPIGGKVKLYVDPDDPTLTVLDPGGHAPTVRIGIGVMGVAAGIAILIPAIRALLR